MQSVETRAAAKAASSARRKGGSASSVPPDARPNAHLAKSQDINVCKTFPTLVKSHIKKIEDNVVTQKQLESMLQDVIDIVKDAHDDSDGDAPMSSGHTDRGPRAYMMTVLKIEEADPASDVIGGPTPSGRQRLYHPRIESVDWRTDDRVFALLDEGMQHVVPWPKLDQP